MNAKILLRWLVIAGFGGYGIYMLVDEIPVIFSQHWPVLFFLVPYSGLFIAVAYFVLRRQYRHLGTLISVLVAMTVCSLLFSLDRWLGLEKHLFDWSKDSPWVIFIALLASLAAFFIPFYAAGWAYRRVQALLSRHIHDNIKAERAA